MPKKQKRNPEKPQYIVMGVLIVKHGVAAIFSHEAHISYPWIKDRCRENWAIVQRPSVTESDIEFTTKDGLNTYKLGIFAGPISKLTKLEGGTMRVLMLGDIDSKWISLKSIPKGSFILKKPEEANEIFSDQEWVGNMRALFENTDFSQAGASGEVVVSMHSGKLERREHAESKE